MTGPRQGNSMQMMRKQKNEGNSRESESLLNMFIKTSFRIERKSERKRDFAGRIPWLLIPD